MVHLEKDEKIIKTIRRHWFIIFIKGFGLGFFALFPLIVIIAFSWLIDSEIWSIEEMELAKREIWLIFTFAYCLWLLILWTVFFREWTDYYLDVWYITPKRILDIEQRSLFNREVISLRFEQLQDATIEVVGILPTLLGYGDVHVQTAGRGREIILHDAKNPVEVKKLILALHTKATDRIREVKIAE